MVIDSVIDEKQQCSDHHDHRQTSMMSQAGHHDDRETSVISVTDYHNQREASMIPETGSLTDGSNHSTN